MADIIVIQQGSDNAPTPDGFHQVTNALYPNRRAPSRLAHFTDGVYDLSAESHLMRLLKVLLGDAGVGQLQKRLLLARLQQTVGGANFFDLDSFYGAILGIRRRATEILPKNPASDDITMQDWDQIRIRDGSYRSRVVQFARAIQLGATPGGIEAVAEAMLGVECDVVEGWRIHDRSWRTWGAVESELGPNWGNVEVAGSWGNVESTEQTRWNLNGQNVINVYPRRAVTAAEIYSVQTALDRVKPAGSIVIIQPGLPETYTQIGISNITSDSSHWEVRSQVRNSRVNGRLLYGAPEDEFVDVTVQPWAGYQGEAWSRMVEVPTALAYMKPSGDLDKTITTDPASVNLTPERVVLDGQEITFNAAYSMRSYQGIMAGRVVSDGVLSANPLTGWGQSEPTVPSGFGFPVTPGVVSPSSTVLVDGVPLDIYSTLNQAEYGGRLTQLFWTAPPREQESEVSDVLEIRFDTDGDINSINYEIAAFPCSVEVQIWNPHPGEWQTVHRYSHYTSNPAGITGAIPPGYLHPYHFGSGHWLKLSASFDPLETSAVRFIFKHLATGLPPTGIDGRPVMYPVGIRQVDIGYRMNNLTAAPNIADGETIVVTKNALSQTVRHYMHRYLPTLATDDSETFWKCEAQPIAQAVVNLYLDLSLNGVPQVFDRIYLDPYQSGPTVNLYWSNSLPDGAALAASSTIEEPVLPKEQFGNIVPVTSGDGGLQWTTNALNQNAYYAFDAQQIGFDITKSWWIAERFIFDQPSTSSPAVSRALWSASGGAEECTLIVSTAPFSPSISWYVGGIQMFVTSVNWVPGDHMTIVAGYDADTKQPYLGVLDPNGQWFPMNTPGSVISDIALNQPTTIRIGSSLASARSNAGRLTRFAMGYGTPDPEHVARNIESYVRKPRLTSDLDRTMGTFLRFHPEYVGRQSKVGTGIGFMGGPVQFFDAIPWTPIAQDFVVDKGVLRIPQTRARFLKMEFTNLAAEPFEPFLSQTKTVKIFNKNIVSGSANIGVPSYPVPITPSGRGGFPNDRETLPWNFEIGGVDNSDRYINGVQPTIGISALDPVSAQRVADGAGFGWNLMQWQPWRVASQFSETGVHVYDTVQLQHTNKVGFFIGLREVKVYLAHNLNATNPAQITDKFLDTTTVESYTSDYNPGVYLTPSNPSAAVLGVPQVVTGKQVVTRNRVTGIQFATQQSPPTQIVPDDQFLDQGLANSSFDDVAEWHGVGDAYLAWNVPTKSVMVSRNPQSIPAFIVPDMPIVHPPVTPVFTSRPANQAVISSGSSGGISTPLLPVSPAGAIYVAVRSTLINEEVDPAYPLRMVVYANDGVTPIQTHTWVPEVGVTTEQTMRVLLTQDYTSIYARVEQVGPTRNEWLMHAFSVFDDSILWEFSNDSGASWCTGISVRNNLNGLVSFAAPSNSVKWRATMYRNNIGIDSIQIRPWYTKEVLS